MTSERKSLGTSIGEAFARPVSYWILVQNLIPVAGVIFFGWKAMLLLLFYWLENGVIGAVNVLKIAVSGLTKDRQSVLITLFLVPFFVIHYGLFCFVHGIFLLFMINVSGAARGGADINDASFSLGDTIWHLLITDSDFFWSSVWLVVANVGSFIIFWVMAGTWRTANPAKQVFEPYGRIIVMHLTIFFVSIPVIFTGEETWAILALALLKCGLELGLPQMQFGLDRVGDNLPDERK